MPEEHVHVRWSNLNDFKQYGILTNVDSDETVQPQFQLRNSN